VSWTLSPSGSGRIADGHLAIGSHDDARARAGACVTRSSLGAPRRIPWIRRDGRPAPRTPLRNPRRRRVDARCDSRSEPLLSRTLARHDRWLDDARGPRDGNRRQHRLRGRRPRDGVQPVCDRRNSCHRGQVPQRECPLGLRGLFAGRGDGIRAAVRGRYRADAIVAVGADVPPELLADGLVRFPPVLLARGSRDEYYTQAIMDADVDALSRRGTVVRSLVFEAGHEWHASVTAAAGEVLATLRAG
jgi:hypothetical protein